MTDITDDQRREVRNTARTILDKPYDHSAPACELASFVLNTVDAPGPDLSEELAHIAEHWEEWATDTITAALTVATTRAAIMEHARNTLGQQRDYWRDSERQAVTERDDLQVIVDGFADDLQQCDDEIDRLIRERHEALAKVERITAERGLLNNATHNHSNKETPND